MNPLRSLLDPLLPELVLIIAACALFLMGISTRASSRKFAPWIALIVLIGVAFIEFGKAIDFNNAIEDASRVVHITAFTVYIKMLASVVGALLVLLAWPSNREGTGGPALNFGQEAAEFYGLMLLSIAGLFLVASANDIMLLFLGIELASIPTYIMVSVSRPLAVAQEAGVKYFFLGAMAAAVMLFGFSYLYGTTGTTMLIGTATHPGIGDILPRLTRHEMLANGIVRAPIGLSVWQMLAVVMLIAGFAFKMAAVPMHVYAADVYQGAATPVTAFLSFVPKASGFVALLKILLAVGGNYWSIPPEIVKLLWVLAVLTMSVGNVLGLLQFNVKRVLAYSSIAHTGYMLVGITTLAAASQTLVKEQALQGVVFYLTSYGLMNVAAFGVLILIPARNPKIATTAETFEDLAGQGRKHLALGLAMAVACFSLIGMPLTIGFFGKFYLISPAFNGGLHWLAIITFVNAAISAAYYLKIVAALFLRPEPTASAFDEPRLAIPLEPARRQGPVIAAVVVSVLATILFGTVFTEALVGRAHEAQIADTPAGILFTNTTAAATP